MSTKTKTRTSKARTETTKTKTKKENLEALPLPELRARFQEATGESTKSPNKKFLVRRINEALAARASAPKPVERTARARHSTRTSETMTSESAPPAQRGRFASMSIEELQAKYLEVVGRSTGSDDRRYVELTDMGSCYRITA